MPRKSTAPLKGELQPSLAVTAEELIRLKALEDGLLSKPVPQTRLITKGVYTNKPYAPCGISQIKGYCGIKLDIQKVYRVTHSSGLEFKVDVWGGATITQVLLRRGIDPLECTAYLEGGRTSDEEVDS